MKKAILIYLITFFYITGCQEVDFLERQRLTSISPETYFTQANDFKLYVNQFYDDLGDVSGPFDPWTFNKEAGTDNQYSNTVSNEFNGQITIVVTDAAWTYAYRRIRGINIMLANSDKAEWEDIKVYIAEGRFFRAWFYYNLLRRFGDVPWIDSPLTTDDDEGLKTPRSPRNVIAENIVADLDFAIANLPDKPNVEKLRISQEVALAFKSRVCLYEGTWEKYHAKKNTPFKVDGLDGSSFLEKAMDAAQQVINGGKFSIDKSGNEPYFNLFNRNDYYTQSNEVMLWRQMDSESINRSGSRQIWLGRYGGSGLSLTKSLADAYLFKDGLPLSLTSSDVNDDDYVSYIVDRDPRFAQTVFYPGGPYVIDATTGETIQEFIFPNLTNTRAGYQSKKGASITNESIQVGGCKVGLIYFRYAEVLLNYIEAKAELYESGKSSLSQVDFDISVNELRDRVEMPHFNFATPIIDTQNPFTGEIPWYLVEIRRERRVELALENFRKHDIFRWAAVENLLLKGDLFKGAKLKWFIDNGYYNAGQIPFVDNNGYLSPYHNTAFEAQGGYQFNLNRDYLFPLPTQEMLLGGYNNNPGWD